MGTNNTVTCTSGYETVLAQKPSFAKHNSQALVWAYNRRVDITLLPTEQKSTKFFPGDADEAKLLFRSGRQDRRTVEKAGEGTTSQPWLAKQVARNDRQGSSLLRRMEPTALNLPRKGL
jgi:hypothetical protein